MDMQRAKEILLALSQGIDPLTGEILPPNSVCNKPEIIRALYCALNELNSKPKRTLPENAGKPWTEDDDTALCQMFNEGKTQHEICSYFKRTKGSIAARLVRLGKVHSRDEYYLK